MTGVLLLTLLVGMAWGMTRPPFTTIPFTQDPASTTPGPSMTTSTTTPFTRDSASTTPGPSMTTFTTTPFTRDSASTTPEPTFTTATPTNSPCVADSPEEVLDNPADMEYRISEEESRTLLTALEAKGIEEERLAAENRSATFPVPDATSSALWPCVTPDSNCPHVIRPLTRVRVPGPCGMEVCIPLPWYQYSYSQCRCTHCLRGRGRCMQIASRLHMILAFCYNPYLGWNIRPVLVELPYGKCYCHLRCLITG